MYYFYTPWKRQKTFGFLTFSGVWKWNIGLKWVKLQVYTIHFHKQLGQTPAIQVAYFFMFCGLERRLVVV